MKNERKHHASICPTNRLALIVGTIVLDDFSPFKLAALLLAVVCRAALPSAEAQNVPSQAPTINILQPINGTSFFEITKDLRFTGSDDQPHDFDRYEFKLNGNLPGGFATIGNRDGGRIRDFQFFKALAPNQLYEFRVKLTDAGGLITEARVQFDTFAVTNPVIEVEDYNFSSAQFIDHPILLPEGSATESDSYLGQSGVEGVDFHDTSSVARNSPYRPQDPVGLRRSLDYVRPWIAQAGGEAANIFDYDVQDITAGEHLTYTRTFPAGCYEVYLREALVNVDEAEAVLERLETASPGAPALELGHFFGQAGGEYRNLPLTAANGQPVRVHLDGITTLRLQQRTTVPANGVIYQNYLVFVPLAEGCLVVESSASVNGKFTADASALVDADTQTITVARPSGNVRFYRLRFNAVAEAPPRIMDPQVQGDQIVMKYELSWGWLTQGWAVQPEGKRKLLYLRAPLSGFPHVAQTLE